MLRTEMIGFGREGASWAWGTWVWLLPVEYGVPVEDWPALKISQGWKWQSSGYRARE